MIDYSIFSKKSLPLSSLEKEGKWDLFLSGFNHTSRVQQVFKTVDAKNKLWLIQPQYEIPSELLPSSDETFVSDSVDEDTFITELFQDINPQEKSICVDITGLLRPHILFMMRYLANIGIEYLDILYSEPNYYKKKENTAFAGEAVIDVRSVRGFEGSPNPTGSELLIIGAGYDAHLVSALCLNKEDAKKILLIGFPPIKPEMYQESLLQISQSTESLGIEPNELGSSYFVPANNPFETALALQKIVVKEREKLGEDLNIYLCPLATKTQTLGFYLFYECELLDSSASVYFPFSRNHSPDTTEGISKVWRYRIEFNTLRTWRESR